MYEKCFWRGPAILQVLPLDVFENYPIPGLKASSLTAKFRNMKQQKPFYLISIYLISIFTALCTYMYSIYIYTLCFKTECFSNWARHGSEPSTDFTLSFCAPNMSLLNPKRSFNFIRETRVEPKHVCAVENPKND